MENCKVASVKEGFHADTRGGHVDRVASLVGGGEVEPEEPSCHQGNGPKGGTGPSPISLHSLATDDDGRRGHSPSGRLIIALAYDEAWTSTLVISLGVA